MHWTRSYFAESTFLLVSWALSTDMWDNEAGAATGTILFASGNPRRNVINQTCRINSWRVNSATYDSVFKMFGWRSGEIKCQVSSDQYLLCSHVTTCYLSTHRNLLLSTSLQPLRPPAAEKLVWVWERVLSSATACESVRVWVRVSPATAHCRLLPLVLVLGCRAPYSRHCTVDTRY